MRVWFRTAIFVAIAGTALLVGLVLVFPYIGPDFQMPDPDGVVWERYRNGELGFSIDVPKGTEVDNIEDEGQLRVLFGGTIEFQILWVTEDRALDWGLWAKHSPVADIVVGQLTLRRYLYKHYDGPFGVLTHSYVLPHRGRSLAIEFQTRRASLLEEFGLEKPGLEGLPAAAQKVLESFRLD